MKDLFKVLKSFLIIAIFLSACTEVTPTITPLVIRIPEGELDPCKGYLGCIPKDFTVPTFCEKYPFVPCCTPDNAENPMCDASNLPESDEQLIKICSTNPSNPLCPNADFCQKNQEAPLCKIDVNHLNNSEFIKFLADYACSFSKESGIPVSVTIAQAILETGWGKATINDANNLFGIKCKDDNCIKALTKECDKNNNCQSQEGNFQKYNSFSDSIKDHAKLLLGGRYIEALKYANDPKEYARKIHQAGYASDPYYSEKLINIMNSNELYKYDAKCKP